MIDLGKFMTNLKVNLLRKHCFYGHVLAQLPIVYTNDQVPTLGVGKGRADEIQVKLFVNPDYVEQVIKDCNYAEQKVVDHFTEVLKHEVHHLVFQHLTLNLPDKRRQMIACELADNSYVDRSKLVQSSGEQESGHKPGVFPEDFSFESKLGVHEYYNMLNHSKQFHCMNQSGANGGPQLKQKMDELAKRESDASNESANGNDTSESQNSINDETEELRGKMGNNGGDISEKVDQARELQRQASDALSKGDLSTASKKQRLAAKKLSDASKEMGKGTGGNTGDMLDSHDQWEPVAGDEMTNGMIKDIIRQANETCKQMNNWGDIPGEIKSAIGDSYSMEREIIPWEVVLKDFLASSSENVLGYTMKRKSKRYDTRPGTKKDDILSVAIGIDTSGSVDDDMLKIFFNELRWIDRTGTKITVFEWDTQVQREYDFKEFDGTVAGRGGTDPVDFLDKVSERKFDCVITFTDFGFSEVKKKYNIPMMWVVDNGGYHFDDDYIPVQEGIIMRVNDERDGFELVNR